MMSYPHTGSADIEDEALMRQVAEGDLEALGALFGRHHKRVHTLCYRFIGDAATADDLVQESFLRVLRFGKGFDARARFTTWLHRLVRNVCMDHLKSTDRETRRRRRAAEDMYEGPDADEAGAERRDLVRQALYQMAPDKREVLVLSRYEGLKYQEIAELLEVSVDAVKARAHRAMRDLRRIFHELEQEA